MVVRSVKYFNIVNNVPPQHMEEYRRSGQKEKTDFWSGFSAISLVRNGEDRRSRVL
jgi:hypothetical protein